MKALNIDDFKQNKFLKESLMERPFCPVKLFLAMLDPDSPTRPNAPAGVIDVEEFLRALRVLADNSHIEVDTGKGYPDASERLPQIFSMVTNLFMPLLKRSPTREPVGFWEGPGLSVEQDEADREVTFKLLDDGLERFSDYPRIVTALGIVRNAMKYADEIKAALRETFTPLDIAEFGNALEKAPSVYRGVKKEHLIKKDGITFPLQYRLAFYRILQINAYGK